MQLSYLKKVKLTISRWQGLGNNPIAKVVFHKE
jgi:hypothetical protein